jgi:hypothetical protein
MFVTGKSFKLKDLEHFSLLGRILSYKENGVLRIRYMGSYSQHFIFFVTYE